MQQICRVMELFKIRNILSCNKYKGRGEQGKLLWNIIEFL